MRLMIHFLCCWKTLGPLRACEQYCCQDLVSTNTPQPAYSPVPVLLLHIHSLLFHTHQMQCLTVTLRLWLVDEGLKPHQELNSGKCKYSVSAILCKNFSILKNRQWTTAATCRSCSNTLQCHLSFLTTSERRSLTPLQPHPLLPPRVWG